MSPSSKWGYLYLGDDDEEEIKVIPIKKLTEDCCDKEQLKTIKIVRDCSSDSVRSERSTTMRHLQCVHVVSSIPWQTHKVKSCSILLIPWFAETRVWSGEHTRKQLRDHKRLHIKCACQKCGQMVTKSKLVNVCLSFCYYSKNCFVLVLFPFVCYWYL